MSQIDHIGIVVDDLDEAVDFVTKTFGLEVTQRVEVPKRKVASAFVSWGSVSIELIEHGDPALREARLGDTAARIDHIAVRVPDIEKEAERLRGLGVDTVTSAPVMVAGRRTIFLQPATADGVSYQLLDS